MTASLRRRWYRFRNNAPLWLLFGACVAVSCVFVTVMVK